MSRRPFRRLAPGRVLFLGALLGMPGCLKPPGRGDVLAIATSWSATERARLEAGFLRWLKDRSKAAPRIEWIAVGSGDEPSRIARGRDVAWGLGRRAVDVLVGGPISCFRRMAADGQLAPADGPGRPAWLALRRSTIGWATRPEVAADAGSVARRTLDDPRHDPIAFAWAEAVLSSGTWSDGYARLVRDAGGPRRIGRQPGSALAAVERGEADAAPSIAAGLPAPLVFVPVSPPVERYEGVAIVSGAGRSRLARSFLAFLTETGEARAPEDDSLADPESSSLIADLLGATLVDAQDELWSARRALDEANHPARPETWMAQAPPWPPASVVKLGQRDGSGALLHSLVEQIAPDPHLRAWLLRSWLAPERPIDGAFLVELARAADGRLVREPRFRAWLRAEWTAWARQRYRRVARQAIGSMP